MPYASREDRLAHSKQYYQANKERLIARNMTNYFKRRELEKEKQQYEEGLLANARFMEMMKNEEQEKPIEREV